MKQVDKSQYESLRYITKPRWSSFWHQLDEVIKLEPRNVLEVGQGLGIFKMVGTALGLQIATLDIDPELNPDFVGSATQIPIDDNAYDVVCAFQMLEHLPYKEALQAFGEMMRVSRKHVVISLPDARQVWPYRIHIPKFGTHDFLVPRPKLASTVHEFDGEHYWELDKQGYSLAKVTKDFQCYGALMSTFRVNDNPSHRFFVFSKNN